MTLGTTPTALLQVGSAVPTTPLEMVTGATPVEQGVLAVLAILSLVSWGIMLFKWMEFRRARQATRGFLSEFGSTTRLEQVVQLARRSTPSPHTRVLERAVDFLAAAARRPDGTTVPLTASQVEALRLLLDAETMAERDQLARYVPWLATIGSVSPLLGLLGTVLGVISAFLGIALRGSGNLSAVAPGIATALIATAAALVVAIPAVFGYNFFASRLNRLENELEGFGSELIALMAREGRL